MTQFSLCALSARRSLVVAVMCIASWMPASLYAKGITIGSTGSINFGGLEGVDEGWWN